jgi:hypothetical protein
MNNTHSLVLACAAMAVLVFIVGLRLLQSRVAEMKAKRIHPQAASNSIQTAARLENVQAADNYKNLFEAPVLFYALCAVALATDYAPDWLVTGAWVFVALRYLHSLIQCTYNKVMHRFVVFISSLSLLIFLWVFYALNFLNQSTVL